MFPRLYAILDIDLLERRQLAPLDVLDIWLDAGITLIQLRAKAMAAGPMLELADEMSARCRNRHARFIVNDRADVARLCGADGVHLGQADLRPAQVRGLLPEPVILGISTHNAQQVEDACAQPITYLAIGPVFGTTSKARPDPVVGLDGVRMAVAAASRRDLPVVAIGGISIEQAPAVIAAGASSVAVIADLVTGDLAMRARAFLAAVGA
ncbi:MAG: thiamine phosphate synthase [Acidobacteriota bacterium]